MATYSTNLATLNLCQAVTGWSELAAPHATGASPGSTTENYIQDGNAVDQATGQADNQDAGIEYIGSALTWTAASNWVILGWVIYASPTNLKSWSVGGVRIGIGSSADNHDLYNAMGNDFGTYPKGGWQNTAIDPEFATPDQTIGSPTTTIVGVAILPNITTKITKGSPLAVDAWRYGRGDIVVIGTSATFSGMATANDATTAQWGLFAYFGGPYKWKGLMSLGTSGSSVTFSDSDKSILIEDTPRVLAGFNRIEIVNASSSVTWTSITIEGKITSITGSAPVSPGDFEMINNATVLFTSCTFANMGTFIFQSNADLISTKFKGCDQVTHGGADFEGCIFLGYEGTTGTAYMLYAETTDTDGLIDNCSFEKGTAATHAIEFDATNTPLEITLRGIDFTGYNASNGNNDSTLYFPSTTKDYTVNLIGCTGDISYRVGTGGTVTIVADPVTINFDIKDEAGVGIQYARINIVRSSDKVELYQIETNSSGIATQSHVYGGDLDIEGWVRQKDQAGSDYHPKDFSGTITSSGFSISITLIKIV